MQAELENLFWQIEDEGTSELRIDVPRVREIRKKARGEYIPLISDALAINGFMFERREEGGVEVWRRRSVKPRCP